MRWLLCLLDSSILIMQTKRLLNNFLLLLIAVTMIAPILWMLLISLIENPLIGDLFTSLQTKEISFSNYLDVFKSDNFDIYFLNSIVVSGAVTLGNLVFCFIVAYVLARWKSGFSLVIMASVISVLMIPAHVVMIPLYRLMVNFGWINTYYALIVPWIITPFGIFLVKQYIEKIPIEIENAAKIDGASNFRILFKIVLPISKPILTVLAIYTFLASWNAFLFPFLFTNSAEKRTLPVGLTFYLGKQSIDWGHLMAGSALSALPIIFLYLIFRKKIIKGLIAGSLKG